MYMYICMYVAMYTSRAHLCTYVCTYVQTSNRTHMYVGFEPNWALGAILQCYSAD